MHGGGAEVLRYMRTQKDRSPSENGDALGEEFIQHRAHNMHDDYSKLSSASCLKPANQFTNVQSTEHG